MNALEKIFSSIKNAPTTGLKLYNTKSLLNQIKEFEEHTLFILKNIYSLLISESTLNRNCGALILNAMDAFEYAMDFRMRRVEASDYVYLQFKEIVEESKRLDKAEKMRQRKEMKAELELEHVEAAFLDSIEIEENKLNLKHKTAEYKEKTIENVYDFFEALNLILLSPDWYKRHGGFVGYAAMVANALGLPFELIPGETFGGKAKEKEKAGKIKINLEGDLFNIIFEILKNDKFSDFQDDRTFSPVRESASFLLKCIYPLLNNETILLEISNLLTSKDWQEQFSGLIALSHLKEHFNRELISLNIFGEDKSNLVELLIMLLDSDDEDVKYISADLLSDITMRFLKKRENLDDKSKSIVGDKNNIYRSENGSIKEDIIDEFRSNIQNIKDKCWNQIENEIDIAHSKASLIILLKTVYENFQLDPPESFTSLYPCFTSSNSLIKNSVLELSQIFDVCEFLYILGESILLQSPEDSTTQESDQDRKVDILERKILSSNKETLGDFGTHFMKLITRDCNLPYLEDDFGCYEESFFSKGGISFIGNVHNLNNKVILFKIIRGIPGIEFPTDNSMLLESFKGLYEYYNDNSKRAKNNSICDSEADCKICSLDSIILKFIQTDFSRFSTLKKMPLKEFKNLILDPFYIALYPFSHDYCLEYVRMHVIAILKDTSLSLDYSLYFILENSVEFLKEICSALILSCINDRLSPDRIELVVDVLWKKLVELHKEKDFAVISKKNMEMFSKSKKTSEESVGSHQETMLGQGIRNITCFFSILGERIFSLKTFDGIMNSQDRLVFFEHTVVFYVKSMNSALAEIFTESLAKKNTRILREFLGVMYFNQLFVKYILDNFDYSLLSSLLDYSDPSFNVLFVKPLLKNRDSSSDPSTLSKIICSILLETNEKIDDKELLQLIEKEKTEVEMIINPGLIKDYEVKVKSKIILRDYQKEGVKWLAFLFKFNLNGILADDMGLGKTVQVLSYLINEMAGDGKKEDSNNCSKDKDLKQRALVLCPSSLTSHWQDEMANCFGKKSSIYDSKNTFQTSDIIICSYDTLRRDSWLEKRSWFMIIIDEGHVLKNRNTVLYTKVKSLKSDKKVILTGTPVHNTVEDLFSLFEIIMPSYLGTESEFLSKYNCKVTDRNFQVMEKRLEKLHKKTLPFIMRRLKSDVLKDLPPKIIKDIIVDLNAEQSKLYSSCCENDGPEMEQDEGTGDYNYLRNGSLTKTRDLLKLASHPRHIKDGIPSSKSAALVDIFNMCGCDSNQKKILIFFQFKKTIDFVIEDLKQSYENFKYLRLDGSVPVNQRGSIVSRFNSEAIPFLFLTTSIGGLGLNLTSADTVVFYEHDWNPFNDLQAMDRAHRLGQKNTVNVFRLIAKSTIEEKVMNYQNFKLYVANTVVSQQNNEIETMNTKDLLERFQ